MTSSVDYTKKCDHWNQDKWNGQFSVSWVFIKDIHNNNLRHIELSYLILSFHLSIYPPLPPRHLLLCSLCPLRSSPSYLLFTVYRNNDNKPVTNSRDTQEVYFSEGIQILKIFKDFQLKTSVLDDFAYYNKCEEEENQREHDQNATTGGTAGEAEAAGDTGVKEILGRRGTGAHSVQYKLLHPQHKPQNKTSHSLYSSTTVEAQGVLSTSENGDMDNKSGSLA
jgi:hypothetical protein